MADSAGSTPPSPGRCPDCSGPVVAETCARCGLRLVGPAASRLWSVEVDLHRLTSEREALIRALRAGTGDDVAPSAAPAAPQLVPPRPADPWMPPPLVPLPPVPWAAAGGAPAASLPGGHLDRAGAGFDRRSGPAGEPGSPPLTAQTMLLGLGAFSLIVAAIVFLAVTWGDLSSMGKALTLVGITTVFAVATTAVNRRALHATAEALAAVTVMLGLADAYAVRVGLLAGSDALLVWAVAFAALTVLCAAFAMVSGTTLPRLAAAVSVQLCLPALALAGDGSAARLTAVLLAQSLAVAAVLRWRRRWADPLPAPVLQAGGVTAWAVGATGAAGLALGGSSGRPVAALLLAASGPVAATVAWWWPADDGVRHAGGGVATASWLAAAVTLASEVLEGDALALGTVALAVAVALAATVLDRRWAPGPILVAGIVAVAASVPSWPEVAATVLSPWSALTGTGAWELAAGGPVRGVATFADDLPTAFGAALGSLALLAVGAVGLRRVAAARPAAEVTLVGLTGLGASTLPFALDAAVWAAALVLLSTMAGATAAALWSRSRTADRPVAGWWVLAVAAGTQGLAWSLLTPGLTLAGFVTVALTAAAVVVWAIHRSDERVAVWGTLALSVAASVSVPVAGRVLGASPEFGWTVLGVLAGPMAAKACISWGRADDRAERAVATVSGIVAGWAYVAAVVGAASFVEDTASASGMLAAVLGAGAVAALEVATVTVRREDAVPAVAAWTGTGLAIACAAMVAVQAELALPAVWSVVLVASVVTALGAMLAEANSTPGDVVAAVDVAAAMGGAVAMAGLVTIGTDDQISIGLMIVALTLAVSAVRPGRRAAVVGAALCTLVLVWQRLGVAGVRTAEAYTLPAAAFLAAVGLWWHRRSPGESSWSTWAPALLVGLGPSVLLSLADPGLLRSVLSVVAAATVTLIGAHVRRQAPLTIGAAALVVLGIEQLGPVVQQLPRWVTFAAVGMVLLVVGAGYERRRAQLDDLRGHYRDLR